MIRYSVLERLSHSSGVLQRYLKPGTSASRHTRLLSVHEVAAVHREPGETGSRPCYV